MTGAVGTSAAIPASHPDMLTRPICGVLTTVGPDDQPHSSLVWVDYDGECVRVNTTRERQKGPEHGGQRKKRRDDAHRPALSVARYPVIRALPGRGDDAEMSEPIDTLATHRRFRQRAAAAWPAFRARRVDRLTQSERLGHAAEKVAENILEDLFTGPLDWALADVNYQVEYADLLLTRLGVKHLLVEVKRPGTLAWSRHAVDAALVQAAGYARRQKVGVIAVSDGHMLYAADVGEAGLHDRLFVALDAAEPHGDLWWISVDGIYRPRADILGGPGLLPHADHEAPRIGAAREGESLLHPKYRLPAACFAYVGDLGRPTTWHLPYRLADGSIDPRRVPKAIEAILSNYRGAHVSSVPERAIPDVLVCLGRAAWTLGRMPGQAPEPAPSYVALARALDQLGRLGEVS